MSTHEANRWRRQGLDGSLAGLGAAAIIEHTGWLRSVAGVSPYLALFARGGLRRAEVDAAVARLEIHELPSARGCTYVLPASDFALGLMAGQSFSAKAELRTALSLGVTEEEIGKLRHAVANALKKGALDPEALREAAGSAVRSLGEAGKKKGLTTTLPVALGLMQSEGEIRRVPMNGRLDQQRYKYTLWQPNALAEWKLTEEQSFAKLADRFFEWDESATIDDFRAFSGLGVKAAKAAAGERKAAPELATPVSKKPQYALVGSIDNAVVGQRLDSHAILDRGKLIGLWDFDPAEDRIIWRADVKPDAALREAVARTEQFIREDLGDARTFSLDSPQSRAGRLAELRKWVATA